MALDIESAEASGKKVREKQSLHQLLRKQRSQAAANSLANTSSNTNLISSIEQPLLCDATAAHITTEKDDSTGKNNIESKDTTVK